MFIKVSMHGAAVINSEFINIYSFWSYMEKSACLKI